MNNTVVFIVGPTAVGKTEFAIDLALELDGEIVSSDSMQIYKYMDIGSAKPTLLERAKVKHYLVDEILPSDNFSVSEYQILAKNYIKSIFDSNKTPIVSGGTGLYVNSLLYDLNFSEVSMDTEMRIKLREEAEIFGKEYVYAKLTKLDPIGAANIHPNNLIKVIRALEVIYASGNPIKSFKKALVPTKDYKTKIIGLTMDRELLYKRINNRVNQLFEMGLINEVEALLQQGLTEENISMKGIGYKEIISHLNGQLSLEAAENLVKRNTRKFAKRQLTWFNSLENIKWFNLSSYEDKSIPLKEAIEWMKAN